MEEEDILFIKIDRISKLMREKKVTAYRICKQTNHLVSETSLLCLKENRTEVKNIKFITAQALFDWFDLYSDQYK